MWARVLRLLRRITGSTYRLQCSPSFKSRTGFQSERLSPPLLAAGFAFFWPFTKSDPETKSKELFYRSQLALVDGDLDLAEQYLHDLLKHLYDSLPKQAGTHHQFTTNDYVGQRARVFSELANVNLLRGNLIAAEQLLKQSARDCAAAGIATDSAMMVEFSLKLALVYEQLNRFDEASMGFQFCIETQENKLRSSAPGANTEGDRISDDGDYLNEMPLLGMSYNYYAKLLFRLGHPEKALGFAKKSYDVATQLYPSNHPNCVHLLCDMAAMECEMNHFEAARIHLSLAEDLAQRLMDETSAYSKAVPTECLLHVRVERVVLEAMEGHSEKAAEWVKSAESLLLHPGSTSLDRSRLDEVKSTYNL